LLEQANYPIVVTSHCFHYLFLRIRRTFLQRKK
jgi:hypothetical protein